jgi:hypothetical protein
MENGKKEQKNAMGKQENKIGPPGAPRAPGAPGPPGILVFL